MKLEAVPEGALERVGAALGLLPTPVVRLLWSVILPRIFIPALKLGVFDALAAGNETPEQLATACRCDAEGMSVLLAALNGFGFLRRSRGRYRLTRDAAKWIVTSSPSSIRPAFAFAEVLEEMMAGIEETVRTGRRGDLHQKPHPPEFWRGYMEGLGAVARMVGIEIARRTTLGNPKRILDVGGGHGCYSVALCKRYPGCSAEVLDLAPACSVGRDIVTKLGFSDRVSFREGDLRTAAWGSGYDAVLLFNILHNLPEPETRDALRRAREALNPGGTLLIFDGAHSGKTGDLNSAEGFGELFFFSVSASKTWPESTLREWMQAAGFEGIRRTRLFSFPNTVLLAARNPSSGSFC